MSTLSVQTITDVRSFDFANTQFSGAYNASNAAFASANASYAVQNASFAVTNTAFGFANSVNTFAYGVAVNAAAAFAAANTALQNTSGVSFNGNFYVSSGSLGVGTNSPSNLLHISQASTDFQTRITGTSAGNAGSLRCYNDTGQAIGLIMSGSTNSGYGSNLGAVGTITNNPMIFLQNNIERARIDSSGRVGIGNTSPVGQLTISSANTVGGTGYADFLRVTNASYPAVTNPVKTFRLNQSGGLEIINDAYTAVIMSLTDGGSFAVGSRGISKASMPSGTVLQVVQAYKTDAYTTASTSLADVPGLSITITPSSSTSKFLIMVNMTYINSYFVGHLALIRNTTEIGLADVASNRPRNFMVYSNPINGQADGPYFRESMNYIDSPATSSAVTYKLQASARRDGQGGTFYINRTVPDRDTTGYDPRATSSIIVMEIAQ